MCKCEIGKCSHADSQLFDRKINCSIRGITVPLKRCPDFVPFVEIEDTNINQIAIVNAEVNCPTCNAIVELYDIEADERIEVTCANCDTRFICEYYSN